MGYVGKITIFRPQSPDCEGLYFLNQTFWTAVFTDVIHMGLDNISIPLLTNTLQIIFSIIGFLA